MKRKKNAAYRRPKHFLLWREIRIFLQWLECIPATEINSFRGQQYRGAETESWSEQAANSGKMPKLHWHYWWHPDLTQQTEEEMLVKLSVKTSAIPEKMHSSSWKTKVLLALSVKTGSVRTTQLLQIERKSTAFPGWYNLWRAEKASTGY